MNKVSSGVYHVNNFNVTSGVLQVTDPCYSPNSGAVLTNVKRGVFEAMIELVDEGSWGMRNKSITIIHESLFEHYTPGYVSDTIKWEEHETYIGVDSGQAGFFDNEFYRGGEDSVFYDDVCNLTLEGLCAGTIKFGAVSSSGFGDGSYRLMVGYNQAREVVGACIEFIEDSEEHDEY